MNKGEFSEVLASKLEVPKSHAARFLEEFIGLVTERLKKGDKVAITGFGTYQVVKRAARKARNPRTGEAIKVPASKFPRFTAGATLKAAIRPLKK